MSKDDEKREGYSAGDLIGMLVIGVAAGAAAVGAVLLNTPRPEPKPAAMPRRRPPFEDAAHAGAGDDDDDDDDDDVPHVAGIN